MAESLTWSWTLWSRMPRTFVTCWSFSIIALILFRYDVLEFERCNIIWFIFWSNQLKTSCLKGKDCSLFGLLSIDIFRLKYGPSSSQYCGNPPEICKLAHRSLWLSICCTVCPPPLRSWPTSWWSCWGCWPATASPSGNSSSCLLPWKLLEESGHDTAPSYSMFSGKCQTGKQFPNSINILTIMKQPLNFCTNFNCNNPYSMLQSCCFHCSI